MLNPPITTPARRRRVRLVSLAVTFALFASACADDGPGAIVDDEGVVTAFDSVDETYLPEAVDENAAIGGGSMPPLMGITFKNRTDVDLTLAFSAQLDGGPAENVTQVVNLEADGKGTKAAVIVNPTNDFGFTFGLQHTDWLGIDNDYYFFPGYGSEPGEGCDQKKFDLNDPVFVDEKSAAGRLALRYNMSPKPLWSVEFTDPNAQGYQGELTLLNGAKEDGTKLTFSCYFNMYTKTQYLLRRNLLSGLWEATELVWGPIGAVVVGALATLGGWVSGNDDLTNYGKKSVKEKITIEKFNAKIIDVGNTLGGLPDEESDFFKAMRESPLLNLDDGQVGQGYWLQDVPDNVSLWWNEVTEGVDSAEDFVDYTTIEARAVMAAAE